MTERDADAVAPTSGGEPEHARTGLGHEARDVRVRPIVIAFVVLGVVALVVQVLMYGVLYGFSARASRESEPASPLAPAYGMKAPPAPRLQVAPREDLQRLHQREDALLHGYGWVDRSAGVARIPIERAIELLADRGLPGPETGGAGRAPGAGAPGSVERPR